MSDDSFVIFRSFAPSEVARMVTISDLKRLAALLERIEWTHKPFDWSDEGACPECDGLQFARHSDAGDGGPCELAACKALLAGLLA